MFVSPELIDQFDHAASLARRGRLEESLAAWTSLLSTPSPPDGPPRVLTGHFLGVACMRRAWVLMDLGRYDQARAQLEDGVMAACLGQLSPAERYEYYFSYGNTLGELRATAAMEDALARAEGLAETLGDAARAARARSNRRHYRRQAAD